MGRGRRGGGGGGVNGVGGRGGGSELVTISCMETRVSRVRKGITSIF